MNSRDRAARLEKGMYILRQRKAISALEASKLGHGYLTYALVEEGLKTTAADAEPKDNQVLLREWLDYATNRVPQMQQDMIERGRGLGLEVIFVEGDETIKDRNKRSLQRPKVFYRREAETSPLVVAKPSTLHSSIIILEGTSFLGGALRFATFLTSQSHVLNVCGSLNHLQP